MARILRTRASRTDFVEIEAYVAERSPAAAAKLLRKFDGELQRVAKNNGMGHPREE